MAAQCNNYDIPAGYQERFKLAELTFLHQRVFDIDSKELVTLTPMERDDYDDEMWEKVNHAIGP